MKEDITFRNAIFGGFRKRDVMNYIDQLQQSIAEAEALAGERQKRLERTEDRTKELEKELEQTRRAREDFAVTNASYAERLFQAEQENAALSHKISEAAENAAKWKSVESQLGGMMLDAQIYSEGVIQEAKGRVRDISADYCSSTQEISGDILQFTENLHSFSSELSGTIASLVQKLVAVSKKLEKSASSLRGDAERETLSAVHTPEPACDKAESEHPDPTPPSLRMVSSEESEERPDIINKAKEQPFAVDISKIENVDVYQIRTMAQEELFSSSPASTNYYTPGASSLFYSDGHGSNTQHSLES